MRASEGEMIFVLFWWRFSRGLDDFGLLSSPWRIGPALWVTLVEQSKRKLSSQSDCE